MHPDDQRRCREGQNIPYHKLRFCWSIWEQTRKEQAEGISENRKERWFCSLLDEDGKPRMPRESDMANIARGDTWKFFQGHHENPSQRRVEEWNHAVCGDLRASDRRARQLQNVQHLTEWGRREWYPWFQHQMKKAFRAAW